VTEGGTFDHMMKQDSVERTSTRNLRPSTIYILGFAAFASYVVGLMFAASNYDALVSMFLGVGLLVVSLPALSRQAARENDNRIFWLLLIALVLKLVIGALGQLYVIKEAYGGAADAELYYRDGWLLAQRFRDFQFGTDDFNFFTGTKSLIGTNFISVVTGYVLAVLGSSKTGAFMFFSWLGFWGLFLFYRAFIIAVPEGRSRSYARFIFFLPSLVFWPSALGKDAWMVLALGLVAFGGARILTDHTWRGLALSGLGLWMAVMVRPHVAALAGIGLAVGYVFRRPQWELRELALVAKAISIIAVAAVALLVVSRSNSFLQESGYANPTDVNSGLSRVGSNTNRGGSTFTPSPLTSPRRAPAAIFTVVFRPIITDANTTQELLAGVEGTMLLLFALARIRWIIAALRSAIRQPYVVMAMIHSGLFVLAFSSVANFGILVRQRSSLLPFALIFLCIPPKKPLRSDTETADDDLMRA
jgi:hypothetical protein